MAGARADCVQLTTANGGIGSIQPTAGGGATRPSVSNWAAPANPGQQGTNATLGFNDDAIAIWSTIPYQSYSSGVIRLAIDADAIGGLSAGTIKFAVNGGTYVAATTFPNASPIGASHEACAFVNVSDVPAGYLEARAEICPLAGWCRELSSVQTATVPSGSEVVTLLAHGQIPPKVVALTNVTGDTTDFAAYSASSSGTSETYSNLYCLAGTLAPNSFLLMKATSASRNINGTSPGVLITCAPTVSGYIDGTALIITTAASNGASIAGASPLSDWNGGGGYRCQIPVSTTCPSVTTDASGVGAVGVYTLSASSNWPGQPGQGLDWTGTATISGTTLTVVSTASGALAVGQTLGESGGGSIVTIASGSGTTWTLSAAPGNVGSATAMSTGTPWPFFMGALAKASANTTFTTTYFDAGPHEQFPTGNSQKNHNNGSLFLFVDKAPINDYATYANSVALLGGTGLSASSPVNSIDAALGVLTPTNNSQVQTIGNSAGCSTFTRSGNTGSGAAFFQIGDPVYLDSPVGTVMSSGLYYVLSAAANVLTLSATPGGACVDDATVVSGNAYLFRDFSTSSINLQCYATFGVQCAKQADYAWADPSETKNGYTRGSYLKIQPDPGAGGSDLAVPQWDTALSTDSSVAGVGGGLNIENVKYSGAIVYPTVRVPIVQPIPAGTSLPVLRVPTSALAGFTVTATATFGNGTDFMANDCLPSNFYGTIVAGATAGSSAFVSAVTTNGDGTTSLTISAGGSYSPETAFAACPAGDVFTFVNPWHLHYGSSATGSLWLDQAKVYGLDQSDIVAGDFSTGPFGLGQFYKLFVTNSAAHYIESGFSYTSILEHSYGYAIYTKCAEGDVIIINSKPCDAFSDTYNSRHMPISGPPSPFWAPTVSPFSNSSTNTIYLDPANMPLNLSYLWAVQYQCGASANNTTSVINFNKAAGTITVSPALIAGCASNPVSQVHIISGSHEDCNQLGGPDDYINDNFYDGWSETPACFGFQTLITSNQGFAARTLMMDTAFLNPQLLFGAVNPEISPGYYDIQLKNPMTNVYFDGGAMSYVSVLTPSIGFTTPGPGDVVWNGVSCSATPGVVAALTGPSNPFLPTTFPFLTIENSPPSTGC